jgi:hypothetical protein
MVEAERMAMDVWGGLNESECKTKRVELDERQWIGQST